jgi:hypothetical protein
MKILINRIHHVASFWDGIYEVWERSREEILKKTKVTYPHPTYFITLINFFQKAELLYRYYFNQKSDLWLINTLLSLPH